MSVWKENIGGSGLGFEIGNADENGVSHISNIHTPEINGETSDQKSIPSSYYDRQPALEISNITPDREAPKGPPLPPPSIEDLNKVWKIAAERKTGKLPEKIPAPRATGRAPQA